VYLNDKTKWIINISKGAYYTHWTNWYFQTRWNLKS